jgi:hypothetical protein
MERHHEKRRDMARSILPSKNREPARAALAEVKRANRRAIAHELGRFAGQRVLLDDVADDLDDWDERTDLGRYPYVEIHANVRWRRDGDKLNHFIRWAIATTADVPIDDRLSQLRSMLPGGLIGDHAMTHLAREPQLRRLLEHEWRRVRVRPSVHRSEQKARLAEQFDALHVLLVEVVNTPGGLAELNRVMKTCDSHTRHDRCIEEGCVKRCLTGLHGVDPFLRAVHAASTPIYMMQRSCDRLPARRFRAYLELLRQVAGK